MILALSLGESVVNHFARRFFFTSYQFLSVNVVGDELHTTLPCLDNKMR